MTIGFHENARTPPESTPEPANIHAAVRDRISHTSTTHNVWAQTMLRQRTVPKTSPDSDRLNQKLTELVAWRANRGTQAELDDLHELTCTQGFFELLKMPLPAQAPMLDLLFFGNECANQFDPAEKLCIDPAPTSDVEVASTPTRAKDEITPVVAHLLAPLRRYARQLMKDPTDAEDLLQDCLEHVVKAWSQRRVDCDARAWTFTIMRNLAFSWLLKRSCKGVHSSIEDDNESLIVTAPLQEDGLMHRDLLNGLQALSAEHRKILYLVTIKDLPYDTAAVMLGIPVGTVRSRLARAREKLACSINGGATLARNARPSVNVN